MSIYAYLRVSTDQQDVNSQRIGIEEFCTSKGWVIDEWIMDEGVSGATELSKRKLGKLLKKCKKGDTLVFSEISRIARKLVIVFEVIKACSEKGVKIYTVKDRYVLEDSIQSKVIVTVMGLAAEIERDLIRQRTREGIKRARAAGKIIGRPKGRKNDHYKLDDKDAYLKSMVIDDYKRGNIAAAARKCHVNAVTIARWKKCMLMKKD